MVGLDGYVVFTALVVSINHALTIEVRICFGVHPEPWISFSPSFHGKAAFIHTAEPGFT